MTKRVALITGAARGIGRAILDDLARDHAVAFTYNSSDPGPVLAEHSSALAIRADLSDPDVASSIVAQVVKDFARLDTVVLNAGTIATTPFDDWDLAAHQNNFNVNLFAPMAILSSALPHLAPGASVVAISSVNAVLPPKGAAAYGASKAAMNLWVRAAAKELGPTGIRVNAIAPGAIERVEAPRPPDLVELFVKETALGRVGTPEDVAKVVRFLASDDAGFITGEVLTVSGGYRL